MYFLFTFFSAFMYQFSGIFVANLFFVLLLFRNRYIRCANKKSIFLLSLFLIWTCISAIAFFLDYRYFTERNIVQMIFNVQYVFLCLDIKYDKEKFEKNYIGCSLVLCIYMIVMFLYTGTYREIVSIFYTGRMWGEGLIQGWPNSTALPIIYALFLVFKDKNIKFRKILISVFFITTILTTSRACILAATAIIVYFVAVRGRKISLNVVLSIVAVSTVVILIFMYFIKHNEGLAYRFSVKWDRQEILRAVIDYSTRRPITGYGGNSFDIVYDLFGSNVTRYNWDHTHNTALELILRYGYVGLVLFTYFMISVFKKLKRSDNKFMFLLLMAMSMTQIYFRNFIFISILFFILQQDRCEEIE